MEVSKFWKIVEFPKISIKMKNFKIFGEAQTASYLKKIIQPPTRLKLPIIVSGTNIFLWRYTGIYRHLLSKSFSTAVLECPEMVQCKCFYWPIRNMVAGKFVEWVWFLAVLQNEWSFLLVFFWLWDFLLENVRLKDKLQIWGFELFIFWCKFRFSRLF